MMRLLIFLFCLTLPTLTLCAFDTKAAPSASPLVGTEFQDDLFALDSYERINDFNFIRGDGKNGFMAQFSVDFSLRLNIIF